MSNHAHILLRMQTSTPSNLMQRLGTSYAQYFNGRHGHVGKVFQNRYGAYPIEDETHLLTAVRYIHRNPCEAGARSLTDSPWTSFREISGAQEGLEGKGIADAEATLSLFGGLEDFLEFHQRDNEVEAIVHTGARGPRMDDAHAREIASRLFGIDFSDKIAAMPKTQRNEAIAALRGKGLSIRQIERLTGIGRKIVASAKPMGR